MEPFKSGTSSTFSRVKSDTISKWKGIKNSVTGLAKVYGAVLEIHLEIWPVD